MPESLSIPVLRGPVPLAHLLLHNFVRNGDMAIDATCGNGHDTVLLASLIGADGHLFGFDIQPQAIIETSRRLADADLAGRTTLLLASHERVAEHVTKPVQVVLFNLGYLPRGDRSIITHPESTVAALVQSQQLIAPGGVVLVTIYPGHDGGAKEQSSVENWAARLDPRAFYSWRMEQTNTRPNAPYLLLVQKAP